MLITSSFPKAILHIDANAFFASCEVAVNPSLRGKPVVTGLERGIASAMSYEAKAMGVTRGMRISEIRKRCPNAIILPSDYETYSLFSARMFAIVRRYTSLIEEYSIDECFADISGLRRPLHMSYIDIAHKIKTALQSELGMTFSLGLAPNKVIAKLASNWVKPDGLTAISGRDIHTFLETTPVGKIWGIGPQTTAHLAQFGITTALQFALKNEQWVTAHMSKPYHEIWRELHGESVYPLSTSEKHDYQSISKTRTLTPPSADREFVFAQLSKNIENACIKARRHKLVAQKIVFFLKTQEFQYRGLELKLSRPVAVPEEIVPLVRTKFYEVFKKDTPYRASGIVLAGLIPDTTAQLDLFGASARIEGTNKIYEALDALSARYGKHAVYLGSSHKAMQNAQHEGNRGMQSLRKTDLMHGETARKRIAIPMLGNVV